MINIIFDNIIFDLQKIGGISSYWNQLSKHVEENKAGLFFVRYINGRKLTRALPVVCRNAVFHSSYFRLGLGPKVRNVVTIHDLIYEHGLVNTRNSRIALVQRKLAIRHAAAIICISESTKRDFCDYYGEYVKATPIYVVHHGVNVKLSDIDSEVAFGKVSNLVGDNSASYCLFVGGRSHYKNFEGAVAGFANSLCAREGYKLICTGAPFDDNEIRLLQRHSVADLVFNIGYLKDAEMQGLYEHAFVLLYTSRYEGFGLPPLEAMQVGCPVIASNISSIPEVVGDAGLLVDPNDFGAISTALNNLLMNVTMRDALICLGKLRAAQFTWQKSAQEHMNIYSNLS